MGKVKFAVRVDANGMDIDMDDTGENILIYLALIAIKVTADIGAEHVKTFRKAICDMIMFAPTNGDNNG